MTGETWFDSPTAGLIGGIGGGLIGVWGAVFGSLCSLLIPRGQGKRLLLGSMVVQAVLGVAVLLTGVTALALGQPFFVWYGLLVGGVLMTLLGCAFFFTLRRRYRAVELRKMQADELR
jgi:hypothetical protein